MRTIAASSYLALTFGLVACGNSSSSTPPSDAPDSATTPGNDASLNPDAPPGGLDSGVVNPGDASSTLPPLPTLNHVTGSVVGDSVKVHFDPVDGAKDYRIYVLPADGDVSATSDGHVTVKNAIYRCAGARMAPNAGADVVSGASGWIRTLVDQQDIDGYTRSKAEATLGYVYTTEGDGRIPVYALGDPGAKADNECYYGRWSESRSKKYTTSADERAAMIKARWRDDGIAFYVPASGGAPLYTATSTDGSTRYYYVDGPEAKVRKGGAAAFNVLAAAGTGTAPLMRVFYANACGNSHDELAAGQAKFDKAYHQGDVPLNDLHWSGITGPTTLVVEAIDDLCPYPGRLAPVSKPAYTGSFGTTPLPYEAWITLDDAQKASATGEVSINGQGDGTNPKPIARSYVQVSPTTPTGFDYFEGFSPGTTMAPFTDADCGATGGNSCWQQFRRVSKDYDTDFMFTETDRNAFAPVLGELWTGLADVSADVGGKFRFTPKIKGRMASDSFLYVTMETDTFTTGRRYPTLVVSDVVLPIDWNFPSGHSLVVQSFPFNTASWPNQFQVEVCDSRNWDVNQQCPAFHDLHENLDPNDANTVVGLAPVPEVGELAGLDRSTTWEVYASTSRLYLFLDGKPFGCTDLPATGIPTGDVSITFGHVLYHSGVDSMDDLSSFLKTHGQIEAHRHFDNLGFKSGVAAPSWDETLLPCARASQMGKGE